MMFLVGFLLVIALAIFVIGYPRRADYYIISDILIDSQFTFTDKMSGGKKDHTITLHPSGVRFEFDGSGKLMDIFKE